MNSRCPVRFSVVRIRVSVNGWRPALNRMIKRCRFNRTTGGKVENSRLRNGSRPRTMNDGATEFRKGNCSICLLYDRREHQALGDRRFRDPVDDRKTTRRKGWQAGGRTRKIYFRRGVNRPADSRSRNSTGQTQIGTGHR